MSILYLSLLEKEKSADRSIGQLLFEAGGLKCRVKVTRAAAGFNLTAAEWAAFIPLERYRNHWS